MPYRIKDGEPQFLLITSSRARKWIIPKGIIELDLSPADSAAKEAFEEAGVNGTTDPEMLGRYTYEKWGGECDVQVFLMRIDEVLDEWEESAVRSRCFCSADEAAERVKVPGLKGLFEKACDRLSSIA